MLPIYYFHQFEDVHVISIQDNVKHVTHWSNLTFFKKKTMYTLNAEFCSLVYDRSPRSIVRICV